MIGGASVVEACERVFPKRQRHRAVNGKSAPIGETH
jgi:hypothetical protein